jgi:hypothetical protein
VIKEYDTRVLSRDAIVKQMEQDTLVARKQLGDCEPSIGWNGMVMQVEWHKRFQARLQEDTQRIQSAQVIAKAIVQGQRMGKLQEIALRIAKTKESLDAEADKLSARLDEIDRKAPEAFTRGKAVIDQHSADLDAMEAELRQLSNVPLGG